MKKVLFVCTGNTCRSPMAMHIFNEYAKNNSIDFVADSAGYCALGDPLSQNSKKALELLGIDSNYVSKPLTDKLVSDADYIFGLTRSHSLVLKTSYPEHAHKISTFPVEIPDPYEKSLDNYIDCRNQIYKSVEFIAHLISNNVSFATSTDASEIAQIELQNFSCPWSEKAIIEFLSFDCNKILCIKSKTNILAYISFTAISDEIQISNVATHNDHKQKRYASRLISCLVMYAKCLGIKKIFLEVRQSNEPAINLYKKFGFVHVGDRKKFYTSPTEDALIFTFNL